MARATTQPMMYMASFCSCRRAAHSLGKHLGNGRRITVNDSTPEKLGELLAAHQKGLMFFRDELAGWFGSFDKYSGSGAERALWLEAYPLSE